MPRWKLNVPMAAWLMPLCLATAGAGPARPATRPASTRPAATHPAVSAAAQKSVDALLLQGQDALRAGDFKSARDAFRDVLSVDPTNISATDGAALAYVELGDYTRAKAEAEKAIAAPPPMRRSTAIDAALVFTRAKLPVRAAKVLKEYLAPLPEVDETALNAFAIALAQADEQARKNAFFHEAVQFYGLTNTKLEASRPGMKRWGLQWLPAEEADQKLNEWNAAQTKASNAERDLSRYRAALQQDEATLNRVMNSRNRSSASTLQFRIAEAKRKISDAQKQYDEAVAGAQSPPLPTTFAALPVVDTTGALASADSPAASPGIEVPQAETPSAPPSTPSPGSPNQVAVAPVSPPPASPDAPADAAAGRKVHVTSYAAAFPVASDLVVSAAAAVSDDAKIELQTADGTPFEASIVRSDAESGLVLLRVKEAHLNYLAVADNFAGGNVSAVSFPTVNLFQPEAETIGGNINAAKSVEVVKLNRSPRLGGGPLMADGKVVGVQLASRDSDPATVPAASLASLRKLLGSDVTGGGGVKDAVGVTMQLVAVREK